MNYSAIPIHDGIFWMGVNDRETRLFEELWPMPSGIAYNSYLIRDEKVALIDTVKAGFAMDYIGKIRSLLGEGARVDYLIINHIEPDHSGAVSTLREAYPGMQIVGNKKTIQFLSDFYRITEDVIIVENGDELSLGAHTLRFFLTPMVHWPETMMTCVQSKGILFSGDVFGGYGTLDDGLFDDEIDNLGFYEEEALRYFTNVIGRYSGMVQKALATLKEVEVKMIAPTHGALWQRDPARIIGLYDRWSRQETEEGAVIVYASMYGSTERMMDAISRSLSAEKVKVRVHNVSRTHASFILSDVWRYGALVVGSATYNTKLFPLVDDFLRVLENKMLRSRILGAFGSCGWSGGAIQEIKRFAGSLKWELVEPVVEARCAPKEEDLAKCKELAKNIALRLKEQKG